MHVFLPLIAEVEHLEGRDVGTSICTVKPVLVTLLLCNSRAVHQKELAVNSFLKMPAVLTFIA